ncbi:MAG: RNA-binding protein [bacterium]
MKNKLFVGSLSWDTTDESLKAFFATVGEVVEAKVITDKFSGKSKGFGFVTMSSDEEATAALEKLNDAELDGRSIKVDYAKPPKTDGFGS